MAMIRDQASYSQVQINVEYIIPDIIRGIFELYISNKKAALVDLKFNFNKASIFCLLYVEALNSNISDSVLFGVLHLPVSLCLSTNPGKSTLLFLVTCKETLALRS